MNEPVKILRAARAVGRGLVVTVLAAGLSCAAATVQAATSEVGHAAASDAVQRIANHFSSVRTMKGEFVQFGPSGEQTGGRFYLERPGKIRFDYEDPSGFWVVSDGESVVIHNDKLRTADLYPLSKTPLKLLLDNRIDLSGDKVQSVTEGDSLITIKLADRSLFGDSTIAMMFDPESYALRQWTITDAQGRDTTVVVYDVKEGVDVDPGRFKINYRKVNELNTPDNMR